MKRAEAQPKHLLANTPIRPKLLIVEGVMGAGKSSTAQFIDSYLQERGIQTQLYLEGNLEHPADYESVACLHGAEYAGLLHKYEKDSAWLREIAVPHGDDWLIFYEKERRRRGESFSNSLYDELAKFDIYNGLPLHKHQALMRQRWTQFAEQQLQQETTVIFECCFLQNPMCKFLAQHNASPYAIVDHILHIADIIQPLYPALIYMHSSNIPQTIDRATQERPKEWLDFVIRYHTEQAYGQANGLHGLDGFLQFLAVRQALEMDICRRMPTPERTIILEDSDSPADAENVWTKRLEGLEAFLDAVFQF